MEIEVEGVTLDELIARLEWESLMAQAEARIQAKLARQEEQMALIEAGWFESSVRRGGLQWLA